jgi:elongation factor P
MAESISTNQFKNGMHVEVDGLIWRIVEFQHVKPGKGGAFVRTKLKAVDSGKVVERTFRAGESMPRVQTSTEDVQYLFDDGTNYVFMRVANYEQVALSHEAVAAEVAYLKEGDVASLLSFDDVPASLQLPASVELEVSQTEPGVKGDTVSNVTKAATLETGAVVQVPLFVNEGDRVKVDTRDGRYLSRA